MKRPPADPAAKLDALLPASLGSATSSFGEIKK
jgi:hypothetical protein